MLHSCTYVSERMYKIFLQDCVKALDRCNANQAKRTHLDKYGDDADCLQSIYSTHKPFFTIIFLSYLGYISLVSYGRIVEYIFTHTHKTVTWPGKQNVGHGFKFTFYFWHPLLLGVCLLHGYCTNATLDTMRSFL